MIRTVVVATSLALVVNGAAAQEARKGVFSSTASREQAEADYAAVFGVVPERPRPAPVVVAPAVSERPRSEEPPRKDAPKTSGVSSGGRQVPDHILRILRQGSPPGSGGRWVTRVLLPGPPRPVLVASSSVLVASSSVERMPDVDRIVLRPVPVVGDSVGENRVVPVARVAVGAVTEFVGDRIVVKDDKPAKSAVRVEKTAGGMTGTVMQLVAFARGRGADE